MTNSLDGPLGGSHKKQSRVGSQYRANSTIQNPSMPRLPISTDSPAGAPRLCLNIVFCETKKRDHRKRHLRLYNTIPLQYLLGFITMSQSYEASLDNGVDQEVHDLLAFLQGFEIHPPSATKAAPPPSTRRSSPLQQRVRQPLATLPSNQLAKSELALDKEEEEESLTTKPLISPRTRKDDCRRERHGQTWAERMSSALSDWKDKHDRWTQQILAEQRIQLQAQHEKELERVRQELHMYYRQAFGAWQQEYLSLAAQGQTPPNIMAESNLVLEQLETPVAANNVEKCTTAAESRRERWQSPDGKQITRYSNGARREENPDGSTVTRFANGDVQTTGSFNDSPTKLCYFYSTTGTLRMDQHDGSVIWCFPNSQRERHYPDGRVEVAEWATSKTSKELDL